MIAFTALTSLFSSSLLTGMLSILFQAVCIIHKGCANALSKVQPLKRLWSQSVPWILSTLYKNMPTLSRQSRIVSLFAFLYAISFFAHHFRAIGVFHFLDSRSLAVQDGSSALCTAGDLGFLSVQLQLVVYSRPLCHRCTLPPGFFLLSFTEAMSFIYEATVSHPFWLISRYKLSFVLQ